MLFAWLVEFPFKQYIQLQLSHLMGLKTAKIDTVLIFVRFRGFSGRNPRRIKIPQCRYRRGGCENCSRTSFSSRVVARQCCAVGEVFFAVGSVERRCASHRGGQDGRVPMLRVGRKRDCCYGQLGCTKRVLLNTTASECLDCCVVRNGDREQRS